jgi:class 3 adenylate cyclase/CheY-like chemotaxis protein
MANEKILVIDDSAQIRDFLGRQLLPHEGYACVTAADGRAGLEMLGKERPDLVLTDMQMPHMSGLEVLQHLSQYKVDIPVVMMTAHGSETVAIEAFRLGVKDYLVKPFTVDEVLTVITRALAETRLRREKEILTRNLAAANQQLEQRVQEMAVLSRVGHAVSALLAPPILMKRIVEAATYVAAAQRGMLMLARSGEQLVGAAAGFPTQLEEMVVPATATIAQVLSSTQPLSLVAAQLVNEPYGRDAPPPQSFLAVPIIGKGVARGVLAVDRTEAGRPFTSSDARLLSALADYAAISLQNLSLFEEARTAQNKLEAVIDNITDGVVVLGLNGEVILSNPAARVLLDSELADHKPLAMAPGVNAFAQLLARITPARKMLNQEILGARGKVLNASISSVPDLGTVAVLRDVTTLRELERVRREREHAEAERLRKTYERYMPPNIVDQVMRLGDQALARPEAREAIVISAGLRGFDEVFSRVPSDILIDVVLNRYFESMSEIVLKRGGTVDKFMADGMTAVFGWPIAKSDDAARAILTAVEMQGAFDRLRAEWKDELNISIQLGIGVGQGMVIAGSIGSPQHQDYTVIGAGVQLAAALNEHAHNGEILMSRSIVDSVGEPPRAVAFDDFPPIKLQGRGEEHEIVLVRAEVPATSTRLLSRGY